MKYTVKLQTLIQKLELKLICSLVRLIFKRCNYWYAVKTEVFSKNPY